jgi:hypothetical protein
MIEFIEKAPWVHNDPFIGREYVPVFMVKDGVEYFVINRVVATSAEDCYSSSGDRLDAAKAMLLKTEGKYFKLHGKYEKPENMLAEILRRGHSFTEPEDMFVECRDSKYGGGFTDFHGNLNEVSAAFSYRIYDAELLGRIKALTAPMLERQGEKPLCVKKKVMKYRRKHYETVR